MKIENVEYSLVPFGSSCGDKAIIVSFVDSDESNNSDVETAAKDLITQFSGFVKENKVLPSQGFDGFYMALLERKA